MGGKFMKLVFIFKRYAVAFVSVLLFIVFMFAFPSLAPKAGASLIDQVKTMLLVIPPIFLLLGLIDVWVPKETMMKFMGPDSGIKGPILGFIIGSAAAGPLYGAFPVAAMLMKKGTSFTNILIFIGAWSTTKIPMLLFEMKALGFRFAISRLAIDLVGIVIIALALKLSVSQKEIDRIYKIAENIETPKKQK